MSWIISSILSFKIVFVCHLLLTVSSVQCNDKNDVQIQENQRSNSDNLIVSLINNIINLKDTNLLKSGIEASVRSVFSKPLTSAVYALSMLVGVVAMLAFYESPVSPMPVPPLPDPPVGRFPPEHPIWPPPPKDPIRMSDKKRVGGANTFTVPNSHTSSSFNSQSQNMFPHMNAYQKYSEMDPTATVAAYQQLLNLLENRNSKVNNKQNKFTSNSVPNHLSDMSGQVYPLITSESNPKVISSNESSIKLQSLYSTNSELNPNDRRESIDFMNTFHHKNSLNDAFDKFKDFNNVNKLPNLETTKDKGEKFNYTSVASSDSNSLRRVKIRNNEQQT